jgi:hypothetical protein
MVIVKKLGICMDHANAHVMEYITGLVKTETISSKFTQESKNESLEKSENIMHNKEQHDATAYYKELGELIRGYDDVLLFGATNAKVELYNLLKKDHRFEKIKIEVKQTDKMTENQEHAFVMEHFSAQ